MDCPDSDKPEEMAQIDERQAKKYLMLELEAEAKIRAVKQIKGLLRKPGQIEKVEDLTLEYQNTFNIQLFSPTQLPEMIARTERKKASIDAMLNTAMTQQLEGVKRGLANLQSSVENIQEVKAEYVEVEEGLVEVPGLVGKLHDIQEENKTHIQLRTAMKNIESIIALPETISQTKTIIEDGDLFLVG